MLQHKGEKTETEETKLAVRRNGQTHYSKLCTTSYTNAEIEKIQRGGKNPNTTKNTKRTVSDLEML